MALYIYLTAGWQVEENSTKKYLYAYTDENGDEKGATGPGDGAC